MNEQAAMIQKPTKEAGGNKVKDLYRSAGGIFQPVK
jgi:hypothetical protein